MLVITKENITPSNLFRLLGENDYIFTIIFENESNLKDKIGLYASAKLLYTKKEREEFSIKDDFFIDNQCNGKIKLDFIKSDLNADDKVLFQLDGINCTDINHIIYLPHKLSIEVDPTGLKSIPKIEIPYEPTSDLEYENIFYNWYSRLINNNLSLLYEEKMEYIGFDFAFNKGKTRSELLKKFSLNLDEVYKESLMWVSYYGTKEKIEGLNDFEKREYQDHKEAIWIRKINAFLKELLQSGKLTENIDDYKNKVEKIFTELKKIRTERLFGFKEPLIYWNIESYLHIIMRHFRDTKLGKNNLSKSEIPYRIEDLKLLIENVIENIADEVSEHFKNNNNSKFFRSGSRAVYYNGDYYSLDIDSTGRIESFYKN